jgi:preprotein translocase subunit SecG
VFEKLKKNSKANDSPVKWRSISVAALLVLVVLLSASTGIYAGASFFAQQAPNVTITTTTFTTTTSWTTSTIWSTVTSVVQGVWTTVQYTTSTSTVTVTGGTNTGTFGTTSAAGTSIGGAAGYIAATKYTLSQAGTVTQVSVYSANSGHVKVAIYADNNGAPGTFLVANNAATTVTGGQWTTISVGPTSLAAGTYWIAFNEDANSLRVYRSGGTKQAAYMSYGFSNDMPTNWTPNGYQSADYVCYATYTY